MIEALDLRDATLVGHSTGGGEVARYIGRHGTGRVAKAALISAVPPIMVKSDANPEGLPIDVFDGLRAGLVKDRFQFYKDLAAPAFSETDFTADLEKIDVPTLVLHGEDDQIVPVHDAARKSALAVTGAGGSRAAA